MKNCIRRAFATVGVLGVLTFLAVAVPRHAAAEIRLGTVPRLSAEQLQIQEEDLFPDVI